jgi:outer membrane protein TolC
MGLLLCVIAVPLTVSAQEPDAKGEVRRISPDEAVSLAIKNNLSLESARIALDTKKRKSDLVWNQFLPDLEVRGTLARANEVSEPATMDLGPPLGSITLGRAAPQWGVQGNFSASLALTSALFTGIKTLRQDYRTGMVTFEKA